MARLQRAVESAALNSLFASHLEAGLVCVREFETLRNPAMALLRGVAEEQIRNGAAAMRAAKALWNADPPKHPRDILVRVLSEYGTPELLARTLRTYKLIELWWEAKTTARLPMAIQAGEGVPGI